MGEISPENIWCDSVTGYAYVLIYFGKDTLYDSEMDDGKSEKAFEYLLHPLGSGHHIFAAWYYTTHSVI